MELPTGTVSLLFTDVEGSTRLLDALGSAFDQIIETQRAILKSAVELHGGYVFGTEGDALFAVFVDATKAVAAAADAQRLLTTQQGSDGVAVRMAVHTGEVRRVGNDYYGMSLHEAARVCSAGHGGQILLTSAAAVAASEANVVDLGEYRLKDLVEPVRILQLRGPGLAETFPPLRTLSSMPNNLPAGADEFVGRASELASILEALAGHRLVTLTGAGGSGKTRLALESAGRLLGTVRDGVWFVDLAPLSDPTQIPNQVAAALGISETSGRSLDETLAWWLRDHTAILVLDNCEHVINGAAEFADNVIRTCPSVTILATSREVLGISGERVMRVPALSLDGEAAELFLTRAESSVAGFDRGAIDPLLVDQVCRRLDGLPLAIELAAARMRGLTLGELADRLDDRFRLLTGGSRTAPSRQRTLEAVVEWSYGLLTEGERQLFRSVAIFPDSFSLGAAASIADDNDLDALDGLTRLVEKSLVVPADSRSGADRFQMLETLRQYGRERLRDERELDRARDALLSWALSHVEILEGAMRTPRMDAALAEVLPEKANMRAAMEWALKKGEIADALRLVTNVPLGLTSERRELIEDLLRRGDGDLPLDVATRAQLTLGDLAFEQSDWSRAAAASAAARSGFERLGDRRSAAWAAHVYSSACWGAGDLTNLDRVLAELLTEFEAIDDEYGVAQAVWRLSLREPDPATARHLAEEAERRYCELGSPIMRAHALEARGLIELEAGDLAAAAPFLSESVGIVSQAGNLGCTAHMLEAVAAWAADSGDSDAAGELLGAAASLRATSGAGHKPWEIRARRGDDFDAMILGDSDSARSAVDRGRQLTPAAAAALAQAVLARPVHAT